MYKCNRCLAPLRIHQGQPIRVCDHCGAIQPSFGQGPGGPLPGPPGAGARRGNPAILMMLVGAVLALLVAGAVWLVLSRQGAVSGTSPPGDSPHGLVPLPGQGNGSSGVAYWDDAPRIKSLILAQVGPGGRVTEVLLYRDYAFFEVEDGALSSRYEIRDGTVKRAGDGRSPSGRDKPGQAVLPLGDIDFALVPGMVKEAIARVQPPAGEHIHVRLARHLPFVADPSWSVYLGSGNAEFNLQGKLTGGRTSRGADLEKEIVNYFNDPSPVRAALVRRFGEQVELTGLVLYPTYASVEVRDPQQRENVDRYTLRPAGLSPGDPMQNARGGWDRSAFRLDRLDLGLIPKVGADAKGRLRGDVTHVIIEKDEMRVYVRDERNSGYVSYHHDGRMKRVVD